MSEVPLLEANAVVRRTLAGQILLDGISLAVRAGDRWAVTGPAGSGKTLFLRALALLDPIQGGTIRWRGEHIAGDNVPNFRRDVIYIHQQPVLVEGTVETNLRLPESFRHGRCFVFDPVLVEQLLRPLGRDVRFFSRRDHELSGGEQQIVALLRAMQLQPSILLLDEPTAALDAQSTQAVETLVAEWLNEPETARAGVWVSHNQGQIARMSDKQLALAHGKIVEASHAR